jgi:phage terminase small subunit
MTIWPAKAADKAEVTVERILGELVKIGFANMQDYMHATPEGDPYLDFSKLSAIRLPSFRGDS